MAIINNTILTRNGSASIPATSFTSSQVIPFNGGTVVVNGLSLFPPASATFDSQGDEGSVFLGTTVVNITAPKSTSLNSHYITSSITINGTTVNATDDFRYYFGPLRGGASVPVDVVPYNANKFWVVFEEPGLGSTATDGANVFSTLTSSSLHQALYASGNIPNAFRGVSTGSQVYILSTPLGIALGNSIMWEINPSDGSIIDSIELEQPAPNISIEGGDFYKGYTIIYQPSTNKIFIGGSHDANAPPFDPNMKDWGGLLIKFDPTNNSYTYIRDDSPGITPDIPTPVWCSTMDGSSNIWFGGAKRDANPPFLATSDHIVAMDNTGSIVDGANYGNSNVSLREMTYAQNTNYIYAALLNIPNWYLVQIDPSDLSIVDTISSTDIFGSNVNIDGLVYSPATGLIYVSTSSLTPTSRIVNINPIDNSISNIPSLDAVTGDGKVILLASNMSFGRLVYEPESQKVYALTSKSGSRSPEIYILD